MFRSVLLAIAFLVGFVELGQPASASVDSNAFVFSITPASGPATGGTPITIAYNGVPLGPVVSVTIGGIPLQNATYGTVTTGVTPPGQGGPRDVVIHYHSVTLALIETQPGGFLYGPSNTCQSVLIAEDFGGSGMPNPALWDSYANGGTLSQSGGVLFMSGVGAQFPYVRAATSSLVSPTSSWTLEVRMRWPLTNYSGVGLVAGAPFMANGGFPCQGPANIQVFGQAWRDLGNVPGTSVSFGNAWQILGAFDSAMHTFVWHVSGTTVTAYFDGNLVGQGARPNIGLDALWFGNPCLFPGNGAWCQLEIDYVTLVADELPSTYCTPGTTSNACSALVTAVGTPSASAPNGFTITAGSVEGQKTGLVFYGINGRSAAPWGGSNTSFLCVKSPVQRMTALLSGGTSGACDGALSIDWNAYMSAHPSALGQPLQVGQVVNAQAWFRDPPAPETTNLSNALEFSVCP